MYVAPVMVVVFKYTVTNIKWLHKCHKVNDLINSQFINFKYEGQIVSNDTKYKYLAIMDNDS